ncbi:MAG TPA: GNAT family N-acetyltransferase [Marmoricola sp.]|nr:GNAT family N-acetyltransferase [Marmoricola sp.]
MAAALEFFDEPGPFLEAAHDLLAAEPVEATVVATVSARLLQERRSGRPAPAGFPVWWVVERDAAGRVVGAGMRTAPFVPHPVYLMRMRGATAQHLAHRLHARGELVGGVNGSLPAVEDVAAETARLQGRRHRVQEHTRLFVLGELQQPPAPLGRARLARPEEADQAIAWYSAFGRDAAVQAGRAEPHPMEAEDRALLLRRIEEGTVWVWEDESGAPVHLTGASRPMFGVSRIGPVYTPAEHRGRGYAGATVAAVSRALQDQGARVCLFTDQANPVSNALYERLGFRPLVDQANLVIE